MHDNSPLKGKKNTFFSTMHPHLLSDFDLPGTNASFFQFLQKRNLRCRKKFLKQTCSDPQSYLQMENVWVQDLGGLQIPNSVLSDPKYAFICVSHRSKCCGYNYNTLYFFTSSHIVTYFSNALKLLKGDYVVNELKHMCAQRDTTYPTHIFIVPFPFAIIFPRLLLFFF